MKTGRKTALRVSETRDEVEGIGDYVEVREGEARKCRDYCPVRDICKYGREAQGQAYEGGYIMGIPVLVIGASGSGKSASMRHMKEVGLINVIGKPLPFKNDIPFVETDDYTKVKKMLFEAKRRSLVVDDAGYLLTNEFMRQKQ